MSGFLREFTAESELPYASRNFSHGSVMMACCDVCKALPPDKMERVIGVAV